MNDIDTIELIKRMHDLMDDYNATNEFAYCQWCSIKEWPPKTKGYDENGLIHKDDCVLILARKVFNGSD